MIRVGSRLTIGSLLALAVLLSAPVGGSAGSRVTWTGLMFGCAFEDGQVRLSADKLLHIYDFDNHNYWVTSSPLVSGPEDNIVHGTINLDTGSAVAQPRTTIHPAAYPGSTWEGVIQVRFTAGGPTGVGVFRGTGGLQGMTLKVDQYTTAVVDPALSPCGGGGNVGVMRGEVLIP